MSAKPKPLPVDPYAALDGAVVSRQLIDDLSGPSPSPEARAWLGRAMAEIDADPDGFRPAGGVLADLRALIDRIDAERGA